MTSALLPWCAAAPLRLYEVDPASGGTIPWWNGAAPLAAMAAGALLVLVMLAVRSHQRGGSGDEAERAFVRLCRAMRLRRRHAEVLRQLAASIKAPPVALIVCESAFMRALANCEGSLAISPAIDRAAVLETAARLFGSADAGKRSVRPKFDRHPADAGARVREHGPAGEDYGHRRRLAAEPPLAATPGLGAPGVVVLARVRRDARPVDEGSRRGHLDRRDGLDGAHELRPRSGWTG